MAARLHKTASTPGLVGYLVGPVQPKPAKRVTFRRLEPPKPSKASELFSGATTACLPNSLSAACCMSACVGTQTLSTGLRRVFIYDGKEGG